MVDLSVTNLCLAYGRKTVLEDVSLPAFAPGSMIGLLGPNGVGKSTLLRSLAGLESYRGDIRLDGEALRDLSHARRAGRIGYLPAAYEAVISAYRAVRPDLPKAEIEAAVEDVFDLLGIRDIAFQALNKMSGGQRQMVGLAQVIVRRPAILLLDEPTSALDLRWQLNVLMVVRRIVEAQGGLCLMALHDINLALRHCDRIALFSDGRLLACGPAGQAMTSETLRQAYGVVGRVEQCSTGTPFVVTDGIASPADLAGTG